ncbi:serine/threonine-protein phosphatase [Nostoc sp. FACHB-87]|uniref:PP2C family protein-serine/threonine phosphatase n=1 Tax=Nostocaceae TaxID=1162 RepID=UPI001687B86D|nr:MULTISPECIES: protein phosphatase 2C domain-containing protein [Nostocaceae]MBD2456690.1 serine/threonine-protein phosphatase [Nostoc sp. FACHB-87]MBD2478056.1 serine/threonine-protein phosphatase [Anabaena sp. FACHB-83]
MNSIPNDAINSLVIEKNVNLIIENFQLEILDYLGQFTPDVYYFQVNIVLPDTQTPSSKLGLLRIGSVDGGLSREIKLRETLADYKLVAPLLAQTKINSVIINLRSSELENSSNIEKQEQPETEIETDEYENRLEVTITEENIPASTAELTATSHDLDSESDYLEEEYYEEQQITPNSSSEKLLLLSYLPDETKTLQSWLTTEYSLEESIFLASQVCQFLRYVHQHNWCLVSILPQFIQMTTPIQFFDLTSAYLVGEILPSGLSGDYCAPELAYHKNPINELMSSYTVAALLYHTIHKQPIKLEQAIDIKINPIPRIFQILKISLSPIPEERFPLSQLLANLVEARQAISTPKIHWQVASASTVGLSTKRLQNEDNYGVRQQQLSNAETMILGVVADGMGGMSQGDLASKLAVKTVLEEPISANLKTLEQRNEWLISLFQKANESVANKVKDGGTTLSVILAIAKQLMIAHVGDSRIYILRQGEIRQISEDHSLVALLVASGQITEAESLEHPDRNILTKSIGSKLRLSDGYVQNLKNTTEELSINLKNGDILLLCSDGVWDLVPTNELAEIFHTNKNLQSGVDHTIDKVIERGASDNATLLALHCRMEKEKND